jgi:hypothetical protein
MREEDLAQEIEEDEEYTVRVYDLLPEINGYAEVFSVFEGERVAIRAARKTATGFKGLLARLGRPATIAKIEIRDAIGGGIVATPVVAAELPAEVPKNYRDEGAAYSCRFELDTTGWPPGVYECVIHDNRGVRSEDIFFNLKPQSFEGYDLACVLPSFTWQAYNRVAGGSFYSNSLGPSRTVSTQRPVSKKRDNHIDAAFPFLAAFKDAGVKYTCVDSADLHHGRLPDGPVPVMALLTHDEYWSQEMRAEIDRFLYRRGSLMVIAGNVCWWRITVDGDNLTVHKVSERHSGNQWNHNAPEERTFVSSFRFGGYALPHARGKSYLQRSLAHVTDAEYEDARAMTVELPGHPIFEGVALAPGNRFGAEVPIMYREVDAVPLTETGELDRMWYDADKVKPTIIATGTTVTRSRYREISRAGVVVEARVGRGHVLHMGTFGWSLGMTQKNDAVKRVVLNAYRHCRAIAAQKRQRFAIKA